MPDVLAELQARLARETGSRERLKRRFCDLMHSVQLWNRRAGKAEAHLALLQHELTVLERHRDSLALQGPIQLPAQHILYVGGWPGCVEQMRESLRAAGGELLCHDGGRHDHPSLLAWLPLRSSGCASFLSALVEPADRPGRSALSKPRVSARNLV